MNDAPFVSIIIPCRNEERFIGKCLDSILLNGYPKEKLEILAVDGMSDDKTRATIKEYREKHPYIKLLDNPGKIVPTALNLGIQKAQGAVIMRLDAHNSYEKDYITKCVAYLQNYPVDNVGGILTTLPGSNTLIAKSISIALSSPFGVGNAYFRIGLKEPKYVDTVPFGCYRRDVFDKVGLFNENLVRNQDIEFNLRLKKAGGKILLAPEIVSYYYARSTIKGLFEQNFKNGFWVLYSTRYAKIPFSLRHLIPFFFVLSLLGSIFLACCIESFIYLFFFVMGIYLAATVYYSFKIFLKEGLKHFFILPVVFATLHLSYGFGSFWGMFALIKRVKRK